MQPKILPGSLVARIFRPQNYLSVLPLLLVCGVLCNALVVNSAVAEDADGHHHYGPLPIISRDWTEIANQPDGPQIMDRELLRQGEYFRRWQAIHSLVGPQHISRKGQDILAKRGLGKSRVMGLGDGQKAFSGTDTLKVLLIRIGFEANRDSHLTTIEPGGDFMLTPPEDPDELLVDPPPHGKAYFEAHLQGLSEYYQFQSGGRLHIEGRVLPEGANDCYKLSDVADYGPGAGAGWSLEGLELLVRDMIVKADEETTADGSANLSDYDDDDPFTYIIFVHAGSDWQSDINGDSPNDIPTFFVTLGESQDLPASGGALTECSIIPETTNQDGYPGSIAAAFYHEFGHALGLVDVYSTRTGLPQVGIWDLMDSGTNLPVVLGKEEDDGSITQVIATGVLPPSLGVWNKWFLGWVEMDEVDGRTGDYHLPAVQVPREQYPLWDQRDGDFDLDYPQAIKAGPSSREYFLLENRYVPFPDSTSTYTPYSGFAFERDEETGVVLYLAGLRAGTWRNTGLYDFFLPAGGVLVWHVNNDRIAANLETNTINYYGDGLRLLEADGIQDIGVLDSYVLGWYGSWRDPFGEDNGFQTVHTDAFPNSRMYDRSWSGLALSDIRQDSHRSGSVMTFGASITPVLEGFPLEVAAVDSTEAATAGGNAGPRGLDPGSATPVTLGGNEILILADAPGEDWTGTDFPASLWAFNSDGTSVWEAPAGKPEGSFLELGAPLAGPPAVSFNFLGPEVAMLWGTREGVIGLTTMHEGTQPGGWSLALADSFPYAPVFVADEGSAACATPDVLFLVGPGGDLEASASLSEELNKPVSGFIAQPRNLRRGGRMHVVYFLDSSLVVVDFIGAEIQVLSEVAYSRTVQGDVRSAIAAGEDQDQVWLFDDAGCLGAWNLTRDGALLTADLLPVTEALVSEPAIADVDGDGRNDLVLLTASKVLAFQESGIALRGFPVRLYDLFPLDPETRISGPTVIADATGNGVNEIFFNTDGGHLVGLGPTGSLLGHTPFLWGDTQAAGFAVSQPATSPGRRTLYLVSEGGYTGAPLDRQYYNGRISAYELGLVPADGVATSGWFGPGGGVLRAGSEGVPQDLGGIAPAAGEQEMTFLYPNPARDSHVTLRFFSERSGSAQFELYNLEGELVSRETFSVPEDRVVEHLFDCSMAVSGMYLGRLIVPGDSGNQIRTMTLAVER